MSKKIISSLIAMTLLIGALFVPMSMTASAASADRDLYAEWFNNDSAHYWWDNNSGGNTVTPTENPDAAAHISNDGTRWQYFYRWGGNGQGRVDHNGGGFNIDLDKQNTFTYSLTSSKPIALFVQAYKLSDDGVLDESTRAFIKLKDLGSGKIDGTFDMRDCAELAERTNIKNEFHFAGVSFGPIADGFKTGDTIDVYSFKLGNTVKYDDVTTDWFDTDKLTNWWATDQFTGSANWRFDMKNENGVFTYQRLDQMAWQNNKVESYATTAKVDLRETPYLNFRVTLDAPMADICLRVNDVDKNTPIKVATVYRSKTAWVNISVDLSANPEILKYSHGSYVIDVHGITIDSTHFVTNNKISIADFRFSGVKGENSIESTAFDVGNESAWWLWGNQYQGDPDGPFLINRPADAKFQYFERWASGETTYTGDSKFADLNVYNQLIFDMPYASKAVNVQIQYYTYDIESDSMSAAQWYSFDIPAGGAVYKVDMRKVPAFADAMAAGKLFCFDRLWFGLKASGFVNGDTFNVNCCKIVAEEINSKVDFTASADEFTENGKGAVITASAKAESDKADLVPSYQWYLNGKAIEGANSAEYTINNDLVGYQRLDCIVTFNGNALNSTAYKMKTVNFGTYVVKDVTLDGVANAEDLTELKKAVLDIVTLGNLESKAADANGDNAINIIDLVCVKKAIA